ncbi:MAG: VTT domain-containing protein [Thermodesulfobacteriota bacterium]
MARPAWLANRYFWFASAALVAVVSFLLVIDFDLLRGLFRSRSLLDSGEAIRARILAYGDLAPLLFIAIQVMQILVAPMPGEASGLLGGYLFGLWPGFLLSSFGLAVGSWVAFAIGHFFSDLLRPRLEATRTYGRFNRLVARGDFIIPFVLFLLPGFPKDFLSYLLGMSRMPFAVFAFIAAVGRMPGTLLLSMNGAQILQRDFHQLLLLIGLSAAILLPCYALRRRLLHRWHLEED